MRAPDSLSHGFYCSYQIHFAPFHIAAEFTRVKGVDWHTFGGIGPKFRGGQLSNLSKIKVVFFMCFEQKYINKKN
jgi:hypothetical protein